MRITREVRFRVTPEEPVPPATNSRAAWPASGGLGPSVAVRVTLSGPVDSPTGYVCHVGVIDAAVRERGVPLVQRRWLEERNEPLTGERVVSELWEALAAAWPVGVGLERLVLLLAPHLCYGRSAGEAKMISVTQLFEFAAAHRLYCPQLTEAENRRAFGKCTNPRGHGHNYLLEVTIEGEPDARTGQVISLSDLEQVVRTQVIELFDHKNLNEDCAEFQTLNPSVENIARVVWSKLVGCFSPARLARVRVYETARTSAEYDGR